LARHRDHAPADRESQADDTALVVCSRADRAPDTAVSRGASIVGNRFMSAARRRHTGNTFDCNVAPPPLLVFNAGGITGKPEDPCSPNARRAAASMFADRQCARPKPPRRRGFVPPIAAVIAARVSGSSVDAPVTSSV